MAFLAVQGISKSLDGARVVDAIHFEQRPLQKIAIAGETGSGKSNLLRMIAGLVQPDAGNSYFLDERIEGPWEKLIPGHPGIAYLSQQYELPKFLRVEQVLQYANKLSAEEARSLYEICRITHLMKRRTDQLSGGEQQRTALARLLIGESNLLLLDEPFSNLDPIHKNLLKAVLKDVEDRLQVSFILTSHDPMDTLPWADEILVMKAGKMIQRGTPADCYHYPKNEYVAGLFGHYNLVKAGIYKALGGKAELISQDRHILLRPEYLALTNAGGDSLEGIVKDILFLGSSYQLEVQTAGGWLSIKTDQGWPEVGATVGIELRKEREFTGAEVLE